MQDEQQYQQLIMQYRQLIDGANDISVMIDNEDYDGAITMLKSRDQLFLNCKCIRNYLELTPVQTKELDGILDELRDLELKNIKKLEKNMSDVKNELVKSQKSQKIQNAYEGTVDDTGNIVNYNE